MQGKIIKGVGGLYEVVVENQGSYACRAKGIFRKKKIRPCVGDEVAITILSEEDREGSITEIFPRRNALVRPLAANVDQALVLFSLHDPEPNFHLLDAFLITMQQQDVPVLIGFNKKDLSDEEERDRIRRDYRDSGCRVFFMSAAHGEGIEEIRTQIEGRTTILAGPSGVGKSSLLNSIVGETRMETGHISRKIRRGKHTTRHSELIYVKPGTYIMDTPGFSTLYLEGIEADSLQDYFPEFSSWKGGCRFMDCHHLGEPDCLVKQAVEEGKISRLRYDDYVWFYEDLAQKKKW